jgi:hypothetical protein
VTNRLPGLSTYSLYKTTKSPSTGPSCRELDAASSQRKSGSTVKEEVTTSKWNAADETMKCEMIRRSSQRLKRNLGELCYKGVESALEPKPFELRLGDANLLPWCWRDVLVVLDSSGGRQTLA